MMRENPSVCFEVDRVEGPMRWRSVVADATFEELGAEEAQHAFRLVTNRLVPLMAQDRDEPAGSPDDGGAERDARTVMDLASHRPVVFRLRLGERSGRSQQP
jgi:nitroimidazol reductase NimA-like FMN-containing flavoprotein (pyridoxamine 5'-phosphate oxidase superfamily)